MLETGVVSCCQNVKDMQAGLLGHIFILVSLSIIFLFLENPTTFGIYSCILVPLLQFSFGVKKKNAIVAIP